MGARSNLHARTELIRRCAKFDELATTILRIARRDNRPGGNISVLSDLPEPLPEPLHAPLLQLAPELQDDTFEDVLQRLLPAGSVEARELARTAVREAAPLRAARAARALLPYDPTQWPVVITRMQSDHEFMTASGRQIDGMYDSGGLQPGYERDIGAPGAYPFTRGIHASGYRGKPWTMRMFAGFGSAEETNERFRYLLSHGNSGLSIAFDMATLYGYDSDAPEADVMRLLDTADRYSSWRDDLANPVPMEREVRMISARVR